MGICNKTESTPVIDDWTMRGLSIADHSNKEIVAVYKADDNSFITTQKEFENLNLTANLSDMIGFGLHDGCIVKIQLIENCGFVFAAKVIENVADSIIGNESLFTSLEAGASLETSPLVNLEIKQYPDCLTSKELKKQLAKGRVDLRSLPFITIDGASTRDFDDALYANALPNGKIELIVAIADVSYYVKPNSAIDREALIKGQSEYHPQMVVHMLHEALANNLCSLVPNKDRLTLAVRVVICPKTGQILKYKFMNAIINSKHRLTYDQVDLALKGEFNSDISEELYGQVIDPLRVITEIRLADRKCRGAMSLSQTDISIKQYDEMKSPVIEKTKKTSSQSIVEECMILANILAADALENTLCMYRVHEEPDADKVKKLLEQMANLGLNIEDLDFSRISSKLIQNIIDQVHDNKLSTDNFDFIIRAMKKAYYCIDNKGHFGLALQKYAHFTSPIRRYSDLVNHRLIKQLVLNCVEEQYWYERSEVKHMAQVISQSDKRVRLTEEKSKQRVLASYYSDYKNQDVLVKVMSVHKSGLLVRFGEFKIETFIPAEDLYSSGFTYKSGNKAWMSKVGTEVLSIHRYIKLKAKILSCDVLTGNICITYSSIYHEQDSCMAA